MAEETAAQEGNYLVPLEEYLKVGLHIGTKFRTEAMKHFIYKIRQDGLSVLNVQQINDRLLLAAKLLAQYEPKDVLVISRRENGWSAVQLFAKLTGMRTLIGRYMPGVLTNTQLEDFIEAKLVLVTDPFPDKNIVDDCARIGVPVIALCDTNNEITNVDLVVPCNNKGKKSLGLIFYILAREFMKIKGLIKSDAEFPNKIDDFSPE